MTNEQLQKKIEEISNVRIQAQQQLIACDGALQVLHDLLNAEEDREVKEEDETTTD